MALCLEDVLLICGRYEEARHNYERLSSAIHDVLASVVERRGLKHMITHRAKGKSSLERKLWNNREQYLRSDFDGTLSPPLKDLAAARVLLYLAEDVDPVVDELTRHFREAGHHVELKDQREPGRQYSAYHLQVACDGKALADGALVGLSPATVFEIQVCTLSAHIWNELEHDIIYKQPSGKPDAAQVELLQALHGVLDLGSRTASRLMKHTAGQINKNTTAINGADELRFSLQTRSGGCALRGDFQALFELLSGLIDPLNNAALHALFQAGRPEGDAKKLLSAHDLDGSHKDAGCILLQLLPNFSVSTLREFVTSHGEPPPLFKFALRVADELSKKESQP